MSDVERPRPADDPRWLKLIQLWAKADAVQKRIDERIEKATKRTQRLEQLDQLAYQRKVLVERHLEHLAYREGRRTKDANAENTAVVVGDYVVLLEDRETKSTDPRVPIAVQVCPQV